MKELKYKKKTIEVCDEDIVVVFNLGKQLLPKKRRILDKAINKLPSRVIN